MKFWKTGLFGLAALGLVSISAALAGDPIVVQSTVLTRNFGSAETSHVQFADLNTGNHASVTPVFHGNYGGYGPYTRGSYYHPYYFSYNAAYVPYPSYYAAPYYTYRPYLGYGFGAYGGGYGGCYYW